MSFDGVSAYREIVESEVSRTGREGGVAQAGCAVGCGDCCTGDICARWIYDGAVNGAPKRLSIRGPRSEKNGQEQRGKNDPDMRNEAEMDVHFHSLLESVGGWKAWK